MGEPAQSCNLPLPEETVVFFQHDPRLPRLLEALAPFLTDREHFPHHQWNEHYQRVLRHAAHLARGELMAVNETCLLMAAALLHDIGYHISHDNKVPHPRVSCRWVQENLERFGYSRAEMNGLADAVLCHDRTCGEPGDKIGQVLHDADTMDKGSVTARLFGVAVNPGHPLRREVAHKISTTSDVARAYLARLNPVRTGSFFYTETAKHLDGGRIDLIRRVFETFLAEEEGRLYSM